MTNPKYLWYLDNDACRANGVRDTITSNEMQGYNILKLIVKDITNQRHSQKRQNDIEKYMTRLETNQFERARYNYLKTKVLPAMLSTWESHRRLSNWTIKKCNMVL